MCRKIAARLAADGADVEDAGVEDGFDRNGVCVIVVADPVKVTRSALQNAASIAALFLTTEAVVADKPEKAAAPVGDPTGGMGGMDF